MATILYNQKKELTIKLEIHITNKAMIEAMIHLDKYKMRKQKKTNNIRILILNIQIELNLNFSLEIPTKNDQKK